MRKTIRILNAIVLLLLVGAFQQGFMRGAGPSVNWFVGTHADEVAKTARKGWLASIFTSFLYSGHGAPKEQVDQLYVIRCDKCGFPRSRDPDRRIAALQAKLSKAIYDSIDAAFTPPEEGWRGEVVEALKKLVRLLKNDATSEYNFYSSEAEREAAYGGSILHKRGAQRRLYAIVHAAQLAVPLLKQDAVDHGFPLNELTAEIGW